MMMMKMCFAFTAQLDCHERGVMCVVRRLALWINSATRDRGKRDK